MPSPVLHLFQPVKIGAKQPRNRRTASTNTGRDGWVTDHTVTIYRRNARGGSGIVVSDASTPRQYWAQAYRI